MAEHFRGFSSSTKLTMTMSNTETRDAGSWGERKASPLLPLKSGTKMHYKNTFNILVQDVKEELESVRNDITDLKTSIQFTQSKFDEAEKKLNAVDRKVLT